MLNILRAAYAEPLQFTDVSTVTGVTVMEGNLSATTGARFPVPLNAKASDLSRMSDLSPSATAATRANAQTTLNVANLNYQEFYRGLQTPLTMQQIAYYMSGKFNGLNRWQLLILFISQIEIYSRDGTRYTIHGTAHNVDTFGAFAGAIISLVNNGLNVEPTKSAATVGPALSKQEVKDPRIMAAVLSAGSASGIKLTEVGDQFQFQTAKGDFRFCFASLDYPEEHVYVTVSYPPRDPLVIPLGYENGRPKKEITVPIGRRYYCGAKTTERPPTHSQLQVAAVGIRLTTRSLEEIFYFLGEMVRTELGLATGVGASLAIGDAPAESPFRLFAIEPRHPRVGELSVKYNGQPFSIAMDPSGEYDTSSRIVQLLTDLWALQSSVKDLPAPNVITVTAP